MVNKSRRAWSSWVMKLGVKELIELCIYCWGHPLLYTFSGSVAVWMLLSGNLQQWDTLSVASAWRALRFSGKAVSSFLPPGIERKSNDAKDEGWP